MKWKRERKMSFAAGDVRRGAINRVAAAVGQGGMVVRFVHEYLKSA